MKKYSVLLAVIVLVLASLACQTIMGGGNVSTDNGSSATAAPDSTDGGSTTVNGDSSFPVTSDATNVVSTSESVSYQTKLSSDEVIKFYQDEFGKKGYTEDKSVEINSNGAFTMGFDGYESGKKIIIGGASFGGVTSVSIVLQ